MQELLTSYWFWTILMVLCFWAYSLYSSLLVTNKTIIPLCFSYNDINYGFVVHEINYEKKVMLIEYLPNLQEYNLAARSNKLWYRTDGLPGNFPCNTIFKILPSKNGLQFQKWVVKSSYINDFGGRENTYSETSETYELASEYVKIESEYKSTSLDWSIENL